MKLAMIHWMRVEPLEETVERLSRCGYDGIELDGEPTRYDAGEVKECLERHGVSAWGAVTLMEHSGRDMLHPDDYVRVGTRAYLCDTIELVSALGGEVLCCVPSTIGKVQPLASAAEEWSWCVRGLRQVGEFAGERGVRIALEPITRFETYFLNRAEQALQMVADVDLPNVGVCLDTYHMHMEEDDPCAAIRAAGLMLFDFHVADSNRRPPGQGLIDWSQILSVLNEVGYGGYLAAEVAPPVDRSPAATVREVGGQYASDYYEAVVAATPKYLRPILDVEVVADDRSL